MAEREYREGPGVSPEVPGQGEGKKFDEGKLQIGSLIPGILWRAVGSVLIYGAKKYGPNNWQNLANFEERYSDALLRHLFAWLNGEYNDEESGLPHMWHVITNALFLAWGEENLAKPLAVPYDSNSVEIFVGGLEISK